MVFAMLNQMVDIRLTRCEHGFGIDEPCGRHQTDVWAWFLWWRTIWWTSDRHDVGTVFVMTNHRVEILFVTRSGTGLSRQTEMMWAWFLWGWVLKLYAYMSRVGYYTELHVHRMVCGGWHALISLLAIHCKKVLGRTIFCLMFRECSNTHRY